MRFGPDGYTPSPQEVRILEKVAEGKKWYAVSIEIGLKHGTVKVILSRLYDKIGANNVTHAVAIAIRRGWIS